MSPDGEWMWNGSEWIPSPPSHDVVPAQAIGRERIQQQAPEVKKRVVPWVGVGAIALSLLLPFISVAGIFELTGLEMITEISDLMSEFDTSGEGDSLKLDGSSDGVELSIEEFALLIAIILFLFSPFFFILSAIVSTITLLFEKSPKLMGSLHLGYALLFVVSGLFSPSELGISIFDFIGVGFYIGAFASVLLVIDA